MNTPTVIFATPDLAQRAQRKARTLGLTLSAYVSRLVEKDTHPAHQKLAIFPVEHGWGPVPKHVQERWNQDEQAALAHGPTAHSVVEFRRQLEGHETD